MLAWTRIPAGYRSLTEAHADRRQIDLSVLDALRGLAALYVVVDHATGLLWAGGASLWFTDQGLPYLTQRVGLSFLLADAVHQATLFGGQAVLLFFLISGFCIHYRQARVANQAPRTSKNGGVFDMRSYAWRRLRRLYPPLLIGLAITFICDSVGQAIFPSFYVEHIPWALTNWLGVAPSLTTLLASLAFQASLFVPAFGTDASLWSLAYEFWFYALYPLLLIMAWRRGLWPMAAIALGSSFAAALATRLGLPLPAWILAIFIDWGVWVLGALIAEVYVGRVRTPNPALLAALGGLGLIACQLRLSYYGSAGHGEPKDLAWGLSMSLVLVWLLVAPPARMVRLIEQLAGSLRGLGGISYSLYVVHLPVLALLSAWWLGSHQGLPAGLELASVGTVAALGVGWLAWFAVERHCTNARVVSIARPRVSSAARSAVAATALLASGDSD